MSAKEERLTLGHARSILAYDCETGLFRWLVKRNGQKESVGWLTEKGYVRIEFDGTWFYAHRLAWFLSYGEWPDGLIDHINGCKADNRLCNLRVVTNTINVQNQRKASKNNALGILGVHQASSGRYRAAIRDPSKKRMIHLGSFETAEQAHHAYLAKKRELHPGYATEV